VLELNSHIFHNTRDIRVHLPIGYFDAASAGRRYPVLYMNDGFAVFSAKSWNAPEVVDSLVRAKAIEPLILVGIDNAASISGTRTPERDRANEFLPYPDSTEPDLLEPQGKLYPDFVVGEVMPFVRRLFRVVGGADQVAVGGSSYGGIAALYTGLRYPDKIGAVLLESTPVFLFGRRLVRESAAADFRPARVYIGVGTRETQDSSINARGESALDSLQGAIRGHSPGTRILFNRVLGATHTSAAWRERLPTALTFLFGSGSS
jgi:enterochelin esterase-like enzyme